MVTLNANGTVTVLNPSDPDEAARIAKATGAEVQATQKEITTTDAATISDHITSAFMTVAENNGAGHVVNLVTGTQPYNQHTEVGRTVGHLITLGQGAFEIVHGVTIALGGGAGTVVTSPACATGIGCAIPAATATVSAVGVLEAMHGAGVIGLTIYNMVNDPGPGARAGRSGDQPRLKEIANDDKASSADRGWIKQEMNEIKRGKRKRIRRPPGKQLAHERGKEAAKGFDHKNSRLQEKKLHAMQHKYDNFGRKNKVRP